MNQIALILIFLKCALIGVITFQFLYIYYIEMGYKFEFNFYITIKGNIPINSGTSCPSALIITWINFLTQLALYKTTHKLSGE